MQVPYLEDWDVLDRDHYDMSGHIMNSNEYCSKNALVIDYDNEFNDFASLNLDLFSNIVPRASQLTCLRRSNFPPKLMSQAIRDLGPYLEDWAVSVKDHYDMSSHITNSNKYCSKNALIIDYGNEFNGFASFSNIVPRASQLKKMELEYLLLLVFFSYCLQRAFSSIQTQVMNGEDTVLQLGWFIT
ncbi:hypothetical protein LWI29_018908 [Acer saccharum]|uniref:Uncharacterized protein n=1 Tax=Acer saccharum TaxID=4024 RepID=A0AA39VZU3_ACESA|nr:hypothetical protein LWI29_018908 [Acer saccharum]